MNLSPGTEGLPTSLYPVYKNTFVWKIDNYREDQLNERDSHNMISERFVTAFPFEIKLADRTQNTIKWMLELTLYRETSDDDYYDECWMHQLCVEIRNGILIKNVREASDRYPEFWAKMNIEIPSETGSIFWSNNDLDLKHLLSHYHLQSYAIKRNRKVVLPTQVDGSVLIRVLLEVYSDAPTDKCKNAGFKFERDACADFISILENVEGNGPDITIISMDGTEIKAHKSFLIARSPVLRHMLSIGMEDGNSGVIKMPEISSKAIKFILNYIYAGKVTPFVVDKEDAEKPCISELMHMADKYMLSGLMEYFDESIRDLCSEGNIVFLIRQVNKYSLEKARKDIEMYVMSHLSVLNSIIKAI